MISSEIKAKYDAAISERKMLFEKKRSKIIAEVKGIEEALKNLNRCWTDAIRTNADSGAVLKESEKIKKDIERLLSEAGYEKNCLEYIPLCANCEDTGFSDGRICSCLKKFYIRELFESSKLKKLMEEENFSNFNIELYPLSLPDTNVSPRNNMTKILDKAASYVECFNSSGENLFIQGKVGVGKSFLANCIAKELYDRGNTVMYVTAFNLIELLTDISFGRQDRGIYNALLESDLLILDDFGCERQTDYSEMQMLNLINERLINGKPMIISSNLTVAELNGAYDERIISRIIGSFTGIRIYGEDLRLKKASRCH